MRCATLSLIILSSPCWSCKERPKSLFRASSDASPNSANTPSRDADPAELLPAGIKARASRLASDPEGLYLTWVEQASRETGQLALKFSIWANGQWSPAQTIASHHSILASPLDPPGLVRSHQSLVAFWQQQMPGQAHGNTLEVARSDDRGKTWHPLGPVHENRFAAEHAFGSFIARPDGQVQAFWLDGGAAKDSGHTQLRSAMIAETIDDEVVIDEQVCECCSIHARALNAEALLLYRDKSDENIRDIAIAAGHQNAWAHGVVFDDHWKVEGCPMNGPRLDHKEHTITAAWYTKANGRARIRAAFARNPYPPGTSPQFEAPLDIALGDDNTVLNGQVGLTLLDPEQAVVSWVETNIAQNAGQLILRRITRDGRLGTATPVFPMQSGPGQAAPQILAVGSEVWATWTDPGPAVRVRRIALDKLPAPQ